MTAAPQARSASKGRLWYYLAAVSVVPLAALLYDRLVWIRWVGSTDLTMHFVVTDAGSGEPIEGAEIHLTKDMIERGSDPREYRLRTDSAGTVSHDCGNTMTAGSESGLGLTHTASANTSQWYAVVTAPGYEPVEFFPHGPDYRDRFAYTGPGRARLLVPVALHRLPDE